MLLSFLAAASHPVLAYAIFSTNRATRQHGRKLWLARAELGYFGLSVGGRKNGGRIAFPPDRPVLTNRRATVPHKRAKSINGDR